MKNPIPTLSLSAVTVSLVASLAMAPHSAAAPSSRDAVWTPGGGSAIGQDYAPMDVAADPSGDVAAVPAGGPAKRAFDLRGLSADPVTYVNSINRPAFRNKAFRMIRVYAGVSDRVALVENRLTGFAFKFTWIDEDDKSHTTDFRLFPDGLDYAGRPKRELSIVRDGKKATCGPEFTMTYGGNAAEPLVGMIPWDCIGQTYSPANGGTPLPNATLVTTIQARTTYGMPGKRTTHDTATGSRFKVPVESFRFQRDSYTLATETRDRSDSPEAVVTSRVAEYMTFEAETRSVVVTRSLLSSDAQTPEDRAWVMRHVTDHWDFYDNTDGDTGGGDYKVYGVRNANGDLFVDAYYEPESSTDTSNHQPSWTCAGQGARFSESTTGPSEPMRAKVTLTIPASCFAQSPAIDFTSRDDAHVLLR